MIDDMRPTIHGDGTQSRDFTFIDNVVHGNMLAMQSENAPGEIFNIACGERITLLELVQEMNTLLGKSIEPIFGPPRPGDIKHSRASIEKARHLLDYAVQIDVHDGLKHTLAWYENATLQTK
jgi:UDP-glucose 4-epimerase